MAVGMHPWLLRSLSRHGVCGGDDGRFGACPAGSWRWPGSYHRLLISMWVMIGMIFWAGLRSAGCGAHAMVCCAIIGAHQLLVALAPPPLQQWCKFSELNLLVSTCIPSLHRLFETEFALTSDWIWCTIVHSRGCFQEPLFCFDFFCLTFLTLLAFFLHAFATGTAVTCVAALCQAVGMYYNQICLLKSPFVLHIVPIRDFFFFFPFHDRQIQELLEVFFVLMYVKSISTQNKIFFYIFFLILFQFITNSFSTLFLFSFCCIRSTWLYMYNE